MSQNSTQTFIREERNTWVFLALGMTVPFLLTYILELLSYGNVTNGKIGIGGIEILYLILYFVLPIFFICFSIFLYKLVVLYKNHLPIKRPIMLFAKTFGVVLGLIVLCWCVGQVCDRTQAFCPIPERTYEL